MIRCAIADDEPLAIALLTDHIKQVCELDLKIATTDALEATSFIQQHDVDLLFLDIQMPKLNGIEVMKLISQKCNIIITSAYSEFAIDGYDFNVVDYLLKPITLSRFFAAITKVKDRLNKTVKIQTESFIYFKVGQRMQKVNFNDILYIEALKDYVGIYVKDHKFIISQTMKATESLLPNELFLRIHKSFIVAINKIEQIHKYHIVVENTIIPIGEFYRNDFIKRIFNE